MPTRPHGRCTATGCTEKATNGGRCAKHQRIWERPSQHTLLLDSTRWHHARAAALQRDRHTCVRCGRPATDVDHIWEIAQGGALYDLNNLQSLCKQCHTQKTLQTRTKTKETQTLASRLFSQYCQ